MDDNKNTILAILLSVIVLVAWQYFVGIPQMENQSEQTPRTHGSISPRGARIDDVSLTQYRETVDPKSPIIVLLSPSGSPHPFYAEFGWVGAAGTPVKVPGADTVWGRRG